MRLSTLLPSLAWILAVAGCGSATGPGQNLTGTWLRTDNGLTVYFEQEGAIVQGYDSYPQFVPHYETICGTLSGDSVTLSVGGTPFQGVLRGSQSIDGSIIVDSVGVGPVPVPLSFNRLTSSNPGAMPIQNCPGFH
jgi:hypothetical protein